jgi:hypothetical protein
MTEPALARDGEALPEEDDLEAVIEAHGGNLRAALRALMVANAGLERELALTLPAVSYGFSRGWHHKRGERGGRQGQSG